MSRMRVDLGQVQSKYDCVLGANLHPTVPTDRHIFVKRVRLWVNADGFITALDGSTLVRFAPGPPAEWRFVASAGDGRAVEIQLVADMLPEKNTTLLRLSRPDQPMVLGAHLPEACHVSLTVRVDILDRNFHFETHFNPGTEHHFQTHSHTLEQAAGFEFTPAPDRHLRVWSDVGLYHPQPEWSMGVDHPVERSRGQVDCEDCYSPGWFELPMDKGSQVHLILTSESDRVPDDTLATFAQVRQSVQNQALDRANLPPRDSFGRWLANSIQAYVVRREDAKTVIAGYPWFLDWGRDSLICARGLLAAGMHEEVQQLLVTFGRFVEHGTLPNSIYGQDTSNRDTSDAPLCYALVAEELAQHEGPVFYETRVDARGRTIGQVLLEIATGYYQGTPNGIRMDPESKLIWSPSHFTWMDTNHPPGTPREGYPVEIQALWIRLCRQLARLGLPGQHEPWQSVADHALASLEKWFWLEDRNYLADVLIAKAGQPAREAVLDTALRSNYLFAISLGLVTGSKARTAIEAARRFLLVPGALRSLAPLPVSPPLPIYGPGGQLLNNPDEPYFGCYEGEEDARRKPAYHNGTAWTWTLPVFCEALARAWDFTPEAISAARAYLVSLDHLLTEGCLGHLPEIIDGDAPHTQRGCDAQAWSATEALRVWKLLGPQV
jgi:starch synthase (maltosyl-transferring)